MNDSGWMEPKRLQEDNQWNFGQLLSVFLLAAAPLAVLNAWNSKIEGGRESEADVCRLPAERRGGDEV